MTNLTLNHPSRGAIGQTRGRTWALWGLGALACIGLALFSYRYIVGLAFGIPLILGNALSKPWLYLHVAGASTALMIAPVQLLPALRRKGRPWHRWLGRIYVVSCLLGGVGGFVSAFGSTAGPIATAGFATLAVLWIFANSMGWYCATQRRFAEHRRWMIYSFAMTFGAVTLRLFLPIFPLLHLPFVDGYRLAAWISWIGNLLVAELYLRMSGANPLIHAQAKLQP
jgi:uncharacterized membrane protein